MLTPSTYRLPTLLTLLLACGPESNDTDTDAGASSTAPETGTSPTTTAATGETGTPTGDATAGPDPAYRRDCQPSDFTCDDWGCESGPDVVSGECYKPCTPDSVAAIGQPDGECDEPERPFCSQLGRAFGGDFNCNGCVHICVSATLNVCDYDIEQCSANG